MKKKVLLVEDKDEFRKLVRMFLSRNYEVQTSRNGMEALNIIENGFVPHVIVSDLMMPNVGGKELLSILKSKDKLKHIPVIILSSIDKSMERVELLKMGASDYMIKPFNPVELELRIEKLNQILN
jgi:DNA-binding response OmpR family regulator